MQASIAAGPAVNVAPSPSRALPGHSRLGALVNCLIAKNAQLEGSVQRLARLPALALGGRHVKPVQQACSARPPVRARYQPARVADEASTATLPRALSARIV